MTTSRTIALRAGLLILLGLFAAPLYAQEIAGRAVDGEGNPLPGAPIALHRVGGGSGATVDATTTDDEGRFRFAIQAQDSALYFVALRHDDRLYIGPPARGGIEPVTGYELRAVPETEAGAVASALSGGPAGTPGRAAPGGGPAGMAGGVGPGTAAAAWFVAVLALVVAAIFLATAPGYRRRRQREALVELATIENRLAGSGGAEGGRERDRRRREDLRRRLVLDG